MYGYIYKTVNTENAKIYIGQHKSTVFDPNYKGSGKLIRRAFDKYGFDKFNTILLIECQNRCELNKMERQFIKLYNSTNTQVGYNISKGGDGGDTFSGLTDDEKIIRRQKMSESLRGRVVMHNDITEKYVKLSDVQTYLESGFIIGSLQTSERHHNKSEAKKRFYQEHPNFRNSSMFVKGSSGFNGHHTDETKEKLRQINLGKKQSKETCELKSRLVKERYANGWVSPMKGKEPYNKGERGVWMWVTNGVTNLHLRTDVKIPDGYYRGRVISS